MLSNLKFEVSQLPVNVISPNGYNPNRMSPGQFRALKRTIQKDGFVGVVVVNQSAIGETYRLVDGEHRWRAAKELGIESIPCLLVKLNDKQMKALTIKLNQIHGDWVPDLLVELVGELSDPLADLGFADGELDALLNQFRETDVSFKEASIGGEADLGNKERYIGFNLSPARIQLMEDALKRASSDNKDKRNPRASCLEVILQAFLGATS